MIDYIMFTLFVILPFGFFIYMALDQLLWIHDMDMDTVVKNFYHKYIKRDKKINKILVEDTELKEFWRNK